MQDKIDQIRTLPVAAQALFIGGAWRQPVEGASMDVVSPIDGNRLTTIASGTALDVDLAVRAARAAFEKGTWSRAAPAERKKVLLRIAELIEKNALELAVLGVRDNGTEISMALKAEPGSAAGTFRYYAEAVDKVYGEIAPTPGNVLGLIHREPVGVVAAIVPWNFPMMIGAWKIAPALAAGNSVVVKPAEVASLTLLRLAELCAEAGLPEGVLNVVTGSGSVAGEAIGLHGDIDVLAFTGSGPVGRRLLEYSARSNLKRVYLELGGKSPNIVFADAPDLGQAAKVSAYGIFRNSGQVCVAGSRLLVERSIHAEVAEKVAEIAAGGRHFAAEPIVIGDRALKHRLEGILQVLAVLRREAGKHHLVAMLRIGEDLRHRFAAITSQAQQDAAPILGIFGATDKASLDQAGHHAAHLAFQQTAVVGQKLKRRLLQIIEHGKRAPFPHRQPVTRADGEEGDAARQRGKALQLKREKITRVVRGDHLRRVLGVLGHRPQPVHALAPCLSRPRFAKNANFALTSTRTIVENPLLCGRALPSTS